jgi:hypothetical protein
MYCYGAMSCSLKHLIAGCAFLILAGCTASLTAEQPGWLEGHLKIVSLKEVELAGENAPTVTPKTYAGNYAEYLLIILNADGKKEITRVTADGNGNYRAVLPPGAYILDVHGRRPGGVRAKPQPFKVVSNQTVRVDMDIDTGIR